MFHGHHPPEKSVGMPNKGGGFDTHVTYIPVVDSAAAGRKLPAGQTGRKQPADEWTSRISTVSTRSYGGILFTTRAGAQKKYRRSLHKISAVFTHTHNIKYL